MTKNWNFPVDEKLDQEAFETAHDLRISKSEFVRLAVKEKIQRIKAERTKRKK